MQDNIIIRQAGMDEIERVMLFLKENWGEHHIMANSKELMLSSAIIKVNSPFHACS